MSHANNPGRDSPPQNHPPPTEPTLNYFLFPLETAIEKKGPPPPPSPYSHFIYSLTSLAATAASAVQCRQP